MKITVLWTAFSTTIKSQKFGDPGHDHIFINRFFLRKNYGCTCVKCVRVVVPMLVILCFLFRNVYKLVVGELCACTILTCHDLQCLSLLIVCASLPWHMGLHRLFWVCDWNLTQSVFGCIWLLCMELNFIGACIVSNNFTGFSLNVCTALVSTLSGRLSF